MSIIAKITDESGLTAILSTMQSAHSLAMSALQNLAEGELLNPDGFYYGVQYIANLHMVHNCVHIYCLSDNGSSPEEALYGALTLVEHVNAQKANLMLLCACVKCEEELEDIAQNYAALFDVSLPQTVQEKDVDAYLRHQVDTLIQEATRLNYVTTRMGNIILKGSATSRMVH